MWRPHLPGKASCFRVLIDLRPIQNTFAFFAMGRPRTCIESAQGVRRKLPRAVRVLDSLNLWRVCMCDHAYRINRTCFMPNFADPSAADISAQILSPRAQRASVMLGAMIEYGNGKEPTKHRVRDISAGGIRIDGAHEMQAGTEVTVSIGLLQAIAGSVKWTRQGLAGIAFNEMIDPSEARKRPGDTSNVVTSQIRESDKVSVPSAGWAGEMRNPYRKSGY